MKYKFTTGVINYPDGTKRIYPGLIIEDSEKYGQFFNSEIKNIGPHPEYVVEIVKKLEALLKSEIDFYKGFGFEVYMIECDIQHARVINIFENNKVEAVIPTQELYELMRDWRDYLLQWKPTQLS